jgi:hypothetical protein
MGKGGVAKVGRSGESEWRSLSPKKGDGEEEGGGVEEEVTRAISKDNGNRLMEAITKYRVQITDAAIEEMVAVDAVNCLSRLVTGGGENGWFAKVVAPSIACMRGSTKRIIRAACMHHRVDVDELKELIGSRKDLGEERKKVLQSAVAGLMNKNKQ